MLFHRMVSDQKGQEGDENGVAGEDHRHHVGVAVGEGQLVEDHGQGHAEEPRQGEGAQVLPRELGFLPVQGPPGHGEQADAAHQEAAQGDLHGVEGPLHRGELQHHFHSGEDQGGQSNANAAE